MMEETRSDLEDTLIPASIFINQELRREILAFCYSSGILCSCFLVGSLLLYFLTIR